MPKVGTGFVEIEADLDKFRASLERQMAGLDSHFRKVGQGAGSSFGDGFVRGSRDIDRATGSVDRFDRSSRKAKKGFEGLAGSFGGGNSGIRRAARGLDDFGGASAGATATLGGFRVALAALIPLTVGFGGATVSVVSALGPLVGLAAAAGNSLLAAAQGFGAFKLATMGVADALKEQIDKQDKVATAAASSAGTQRAAARAIQSAQDGVRTAVEGLARAEREAGDAQKALTTARTDARRALVDMRQSLAETMLGEQRAILSLREAKDELARTLAGASPEDIAQAQAQVTQAALDQRQAILNLETAQETLQKVNADATATEHDRQQALLDVAKAQDAVTDSQRNGHTAEKALADLRAGPTDDEKKTALLNVKEAELQLTDVRRDRLRQEKDTQAAEKLGVDRSEQVVQAQRAVADANRAVRDASLQVTRATQALSDAQLSAKESMAATSAAAANLNEKFNKLPPAAQAFVKVLVAMKPRLDELRQTAASGFFPGATEGLRSAAQNFDSVNKVVGQTSVVLGEAARKSGELVGSPAFGRDIEIIGGRNAKVLDTLGEALRHVISALRNVAVAAGPLTQWLADLANKWALNAAEAAKAGRESGKLAAFFEKTRAVADRLGSILGHLASGLLGIGRVGQVSGNQILASIDAAAARFDAWANSVRGRREIQDFFQNTKELAAALVPVLAGITSAVGLLVVKIFPLSAIMQTLGPYTDEATTAFIAYKVAALGAAAATRAATAAMAVATFVTGGWVTAFWALNAALVANPIGLVVVALAALVGGLVLAYKNSETFRNVVDAAFRAVASSFGFLLTAAKNTFGWLRDNWPLVLGILTGPIGLAVSQIATHWGTIRSNAIAAWNAIKGAAAIAWDAIRDAILAPVRAARDAIPDIVGGIANRLASGFDAITKGVGVFAASLKEAVLDGVRGGLNLLIGFINDIIGVVNKLPFVDIGKIDKIAAPKASDSAGPGKKPGGFARGGAFARTGGIVDKPITLMGEEAPTWPEIVVPTNPAYRERARALLLYAARSIGLAAGGMFSQKEMEELWAKHGGGDVKIAGAVGMAESGGDPNAGRDHPYHGLWQVGPGGPFDPDANAIAAIAKWRAGGASVDARWRPWEAYTGPDGVGSDGPWRRYLNGDTGKGGGILGAITGIVGDLLSKGVGFLLDKLPGIGALPGWLTGVGKFLLDKAGDWIKDQVTHVTGGGEGTAKGPAGIGSFEGLPMANWVIDALQYARGKGFTGKATSGYRSHAENVAHGRLYRSEHEGTQYPHGAVDFGGFTTGLSTKLAFTKAVAGYKYPLINPIGFRDDGHASGTGHRMGGLYGVVPPFGGSFAAGGIVPGPLGAPRLIEAHGGEAVLTSDTMGDLAMQLRILNSSPTADVIAALVGVVNTSQGRSARHRSMTAGRGGFPATP